MESYWDLRPQAGDALLVVDVQNDFLPPNGSLAVLGGDLIIPLLNQAIEVFQRSNLPIFASRDWHPPNHCSFKQYGGIWPPHCVAGTFGAEFHQNLNLPNGTQIISKADTPEKDAYSAFEGTDLAQKLRRLHIKRLFIGGLATDYCVLNTVKDALKADFQVIILEKAIRAVNVKPKDEAEAKAEMAALGAHYW